MCLHGGKQRGGVEWGWRVTRGSVFGGGRDRPPLQTHAAAQRRQRQARRPALHSRHPPPPAPALRPAARSCAAGRRTAPLHACGSGTTRSAPAPCTGPAAAGLPAAHHPAAHPAARHCARALGRAGIEAGWASSQRRGRQWRLCARHQRGRRGGTAHGRRPCIRPPSRCGAWGPARRQQAWRTCAALQHFVQLPLCLLLLLLRITQHVPRLCQRGGQRAAQQQRVGGQPHIQRLRRGLQHLQGAGRPPARHWKKE